MHSNAPPQPNPSQASGGQGPAGRSDDLQAFRAMVGATTEQHLLRLERIYIGAADSWQGAVRRYRLVLNKEIGFLQDYVGKGISAEEWQERLHDLAQGLESDVEVDEVTLAVPAAIEEEILSRHPRLVALKPYINKGITAREFAEIAAESDACSGGSVQPILQGHERRTGQEIYSLQIVAFDDNTDLKLSNFPATVLRSELSVVLPQQEENVAEKQFCRLAVLDRKVFSYLRRFGFIQDRFGDADPEKARAQREVRGHRQG